MLTALVCLIAFCTFRAGTTVLLPTSHGPFTAAQGTAAKWAPENRSIPEPFARVCVCVYIYPYVHVYVYALYIYICAYLYAAAHACTARSFKENLNIPVPDGFAWFGSTKVK